MSKGFTVAYLLFGVLIVAALGGAYYFGKISNKPVKSEPQACTEEAKKCPDGSFVARTGPNCEFSVCPVSVPTKPIDDIINCNSDSECGVNTCGCKAQRKDSLGKNICAQACTGEAKCLNNKCVLVKDAVEGEFCGGFAGKDCLQGYICKLDGNYPDAGGKCIKN